MYSHRAFTVTEMILVLFIVTLFIFISSSTPNSVSSIDASFFEESVLHTQWLSLWTHTEQEVTVNGYSVSFSRLGNVIKPGTFSFKSGTFVISLGTGRIYEKSKHFN